MSLQTRVQSVTSYFDGLDMGLLNAIYFLSIAFADHICVSFNCMQEVISRAGRWLKIKKSSICVSDTQIKAQIDAHAKTLCLLSLGVTQMKTSTD